MLSSQHVLNKKKKLMRYFLLLVTLSLRSPVFTLNGTSLFGSITFQ